MAAAGFQHLREILLRIDFKFFLGSLVFDADGAAADTEDPGVAHYFAVFQGFKEHRVGMRQTALSAVEENLGVRNS